MKKALLVLGVIAVLGASAGWITGTNAFADGGRPDEIPPEAPPMIPDPEAGECLITFVTDVVECIQTSKTPPELAMCLADAVRGLRECLEGEGEG